MLRFELLRTEGQARRGRLTLNHGVVETPVFMPVGTYVGVRIVVPAVLAEIPRIRALLDLLRPILGDFGL